MQQSHTKTYFLLQIVIDLSQNQENSISFLKKDLQIPLGLIP